MASTRIIGMSLVVLFVGMVLGYAFSVAVPYQLPTTSKEPTLSLSVSTVKAGEEYTATFTGFPANTEIYGWTVNENPPTMFSVGTANDRGELEATANAPETAGTWPLIACNVDQSIWATATLTVTQP